MRNSNVGLRLLLISLSMTVGLGSIAGAAGAADVVLTSGVDTYIDSYPGPPPPIMSSGLGGFPVITIPRLDDVCFGAPGPTACGSQAANDGKAPAAGSDNSASGRIGGDDLYGLKWDTTINLTQSENQGLLWFDISPAQLADFLADPTATATLDYNVADNGSNALMHRMTVDWLTPVGDQVTWTSLGCEGGVDITGPCTNAEPTSNATATASTGANSVDVTSDVLAWANGAANYGWGFRASGGTRARLDTFESGTAPTLTLSVAQPETRLHYDFNETGDSPGSTGTDARPVKTVNDGGTSVDFHSADAAGVSGLPGDRAFANLGPSDHGNAASGATDGFGAEQSDNPAIDGLVSFTISGWFKTETAVSLSGKTPRLVNNHDGGGAGGQGFNLQFLSGSEGDLKLEVDDDTGGGAVSTGALYSDKQKWVFFAVSYDGTATTNNVNFYIGYRNDTEAGGGVGSAAVQLVTTASLDRGTVSDETAGLRLGNRQSGDRPFDGFLDEIRIENVAQAGAGGLAALETYRQAALAAPRDVSLTHVSDWSLDASAFGVVELSGITYDPATERFWAVSDDGGRVLEIDATFDASGAIVTAAAVSALTLSPVRDYEGIVYTNPTRDSLFVSEEGNPGVHEFEAATGNALQTLSVPAIFASGLRSNRGFESLTRSLDGTEMITAVEQALTPDGPAGTSSTAGNVSRWLRYSVVGNTATPAEQYAYVIDPGHETPVSSNGSSLSELVVLPNGEILAMERSEAGGEILVRAFLADRSGATDVSQGSLGTGLIGETYTPVTKELLLSDDDLGKFEGMAFGPVLGSGDLLLLGVEDVGSTTSVIRSFVLSGDFGQSTPSFERRINVNGVVHVGTDYPGVWEADPGIGGACTGFAFDINDPIDGTVDDPLFQSEVFEDTGQGPVVCTVDDSGSPLPAGTYTVNLLLSENFWGPGCSGGGPGLGARVFDIAIEGTTVETGIDPFSEGECAASTTSSTGSPVTRSYDVLVTDGTVTITMTGTTDLAKISAIEIIGTSECTTSPDCDDSNDCTDDVCNTGTCEYTSTPLGSACDDLGDECTNADACDGAGVCVDNGFMPVSTACGSPASSECDDPDSCDGVGVCQANPLPIGTMCGGAGDLCTEEDTCDGVGMCATGLPVDCDDMNACTADSCDLLLGCAHTPIPGCWDPGAGTVIAQEGAPGSIVIDYEPSGAVWHTRLDALFTVGDSGRVTHMTGNGVIIAEWQPGGDLEGIAVADPQSDLVYLGREDPDAVLEFDISTGLLTGNVWDLTPWLTGAANQGLEGLTVANGLFYAGLQADGTIFVFDLQAGGVVQLVTSFSSPFGRNDVSGLHYEPLTNILYAVHDNFDILVEMDTAGTFIQEFALPGSNQEGVTLDPACAMSLATVYIAEDNGAFRRYENFPSICLAGEPVPGVPFTGLVVLGFMLAAVGARSAATRGRSR